ncbi:hypothetical protein GS504_03425 [Rhodococcus hoagii]|nr:hypothetical protein [Prescottella equi]
MVRVIADERTGADTSANTQEAATAQCPSAPESNTTPSAAHNDAASAVSRPIVAVHHDAPAVHHDTEPMTVDAPAVHQVDDTAAEPTTDDASATQQDVAAAEPAADDAPPATLTDLDRAPMQDLDAAPAVTRTGYPQTRTGCSRSSRTSTSATK